MAAPERRIGPNDDFYRQFLAAEERKQPHRCTSPWQGDFPWFMSDNVLPLEQYRSSEEWVAIRKRLWPERWV